MTSQDIIDILRTKEMLTIVAQTMITIAVLEIGRILIDEMIEIIGTNLSEIQDQTIVIEEVIPTNLIEIIAIDTTRLVKGIKIDIMIIGTIMAIDLHHMITVVALSDRINSVHQDHQDKMSNGLQKDRRLTMMIHSGILDGKEWKCRKRPMLW